MRRPTLITLVLLTLVAATAGAQRDQWIRGSTDPIPLPGGSRVEFGELTSSSLSGKRAAYSIFLPPSYEGSSERFPAVYFLHGLFNDHSSWTMDHHGSIPTLIDGLMTEGSLPEMVLVFPDGGRSFYTNYHDGSADYEELIVTELPAFIEKSYRVAPEPAKRAIAGTSMGGYGALKIAMRFPERYVAVAAHSPIVFPIKNPLDVPESARSGRYYEYLSSIFKTVYGDPFDQAYFDENNPIELASKELDGLSIYFDYGTADRYNRSMGLGQGLARLDQALSANEVAHQFVTHEAEPHGWELVYTHIGESLAFLSKAME